MTSTEGASWPSGCWNITEKRRECGHYIINLLWISGSSYERVIADHEQWQFSMRKHNIPAMHHMTAILTSVLVHPCFLKDNDYLFIHFFKRNISFIFRGSPTQCECSPLHLREQNMKTSCHCAFTSRRVVFCLLCFGAHDVFFMLSSSLFFFSRSLSLCHYIVLIHLRPCSQHNSALRKATARPFSAAHLFIKVYLFASLYHYCRR